jgi:hypothetical protein
VQDQQHRVGTVLAPDLDPLVDPTDPDEALLDDPVRSGDLQGVGDLVLAYLAPGQPADRCCGHDTGRASQNGSDHLCSPLLM